MYLDTETTPSVVIIERILNEQMTEKDINSKEAQIVLLVNMLSL